MSFMYPRTVALTRPAPSAQFGNVGYNAELPVNETVVASGLPASIQLSRQGAKPDAMLPGDQDKRTYWKVIIPLGALAQGVARVRDLVTDDLGVRYQVLGPYFNSLGYTLLCERLEN